MKPDLSLSNLQVLNLKLRPVSFKPTKAGDKNLTLNQFGSQLFLWLCILEYQAVIFLLIGAHDPLIIRLHLTTSCLGTGRDGDPGQN